MLILIKILLLFNFISITGYVVLFFKSGIKKLKASHNNEFNQITEPITTIVPIKNGNHNSVKNLEYLIKNQPNEKSIIITAIEDKDEKIYKDLIKLESLNENFKVVLSGNPGKVMGKIHNMNAAYNLCESEIVVFKDADVIALKKNYIDLYNSIKDEKIGGGFSPALYKEAKTLGGKLIAIATNYMFTQSLIIFSSVIPFDFCSGAFMMFKRSVVEKAGGLKSILNNISDDASLGEMVAKSGYKVAYSDLPVFMQPENLSFFAGLNHLKKWFVIIKKYLGIKYFVLPFSFYLGNFVMIFLLAVLHNKFIIITLVLLILAVMFRILSAVIQDKIVFNKFNSVSIYFLLLIMGLLQTFAWLASLIFNKLEWSGRVYKVGRKGRIISVSSKSTSNN